MFKKFLYGTLFVALVTIVGVGGCVGVTLYQIQNLVTQVQDLQAQYHQTNKDFAAKAGEEIGPDAFPADEGRIATFLEIRRRVGAKLHENLREITGELEAKNNSLAESDGRLGFLEMMDLIRSQFQRLDAVGREHIGQLRAARMAQVEYRRLTHQLLAALALAADDEAPESLRRLAPAWEQYTDAADTVNSLLSKSHGVREQKLDVDELRDRLLSADDLSSSPLLMGEYLAGRAPAGSGAAAAAWLQTSGAPLLDLLVDQYDPAALIEQ